MVVVAVGAAVVALVGALVVVGLPFTLEALGTFIFLSNFAFKSGGACKCSSGLAFGCSFLSSFSIFSIRLLTRGVL